MAMTELADQDGRRVVLIMSDSKDSPKFTFRERRISQLDVTDRAQREDIMIYGIGLQSRGEVGLGSGSSMASAMAASFPDPSLGTVAGDTGGGYVQLYPRDDLTAVFARIADELHSQYLLGFTPPVADGKTHKIDVRVADKNLKVRAREAYVAPRASK
jgi:VWFA-related protein